MKKSFYLNVFVLVTLMSFGGIVHAEIPRDGLMAEYLFEGNANDSSGNVNHGNVNGATLSKDRHGNANSAYEFGGNDGIYFDSPILSASQYSLSLWVYFSAVQSENQYILSNGGQTRHSQGTALYIIGATKPGYSEVNIDKGQALGFCYADEMIDLRAGMYAPFLSGEWHHIAAVWDSHFGAENADRALLFVDGVRYTELIAHTSDNPFGTLQNMRLGLPSNGTKDSLQGKIDNVRMYDRVLSESEIQELYHEGEVCDDRYDEGYEAGKQYCMDNPKACGISTSDGCSQADLDAEYQRGYNTGYSAGSNGSTTPAILSPGLEMHIPVLQYETLLGTMNLWADFEFEGESNGDLIWKLSDFSQE